METNGRQRLPPTEKMGPRIRRLRKQLDLTQAELGERVGVEALAVGNWERGKHEPRGENLMTLADVLGVPPHYIMYGESGLYRDAVEKIAAIVDEIRSTANGLDALSVASDADDGDDGEGERPGQ